MLQYIRLIEEQTNKSNLGLREYEGIPVTKQG